MVHIHIHTPKHITRGVSKLKIVGFSAIKGGVGKTTLAFNYGEWLAKQGKKVLFIDLDHQCNLTQSYNIYETENTIANAFLQKENVDIHSVKKNIDLIAGYMQLDQIETDIENKANKDMLLYLWLADYYEIKEMEKYDYIILDCRPDFSTATRNAVAISHVLISPIIPSEHGYNARFNLENRLEAFRNEVINYETRQSYITTELYFVGNMVKHNTKSSREFLKSLQNDEDVIGVFPEKELFNRSTLDDLPLADMQDNNSIYNQHKDFFDELNNTFANITTIINQEKD